MVPWAILPRCVMVSRHASDIFSESQVFFLKICFYGNNCFCIVVPVVTCHLDSRSTLGSQAVNGVGQRQSFQCPLIWISKTKPFQKTMETHAENMAACKNQKKLGGWTTPRYVKGTCTFCLLRFYWSSSVKTGDGWVAVARNIWNIPSHSQPFKPFKPQADMLIYSWSIAIQYAHV